MEKQIQNDTANLPTNLQPPRRRRSTPPPRPRQSLRAEKARPQRCPGRQGAAQSTPSPPVVQQ